MLDLPGGRPPEGLPGLRPCPGQRPRLPHAGRLPRGGRVRLLHHGGGLYGDTQADAYAVRGDLAGDWGAGEVAFRISDLKAKTFSYDIDADGGQKASTLVYYTDEGADPVLFQQTGGGWRLASDNFLAENSIVEDLERVYTGEVSPVYLDSRIVDMEEMAEAYGWVRPGRTPASIAAGARKAAASSAAEESSPGKVAAAAREASKDSAPRH